MLSRYRGASPLITPVLERWLSSQDANLSCHAGLLLAESGRLTMETIPKLVDLLVEGDDWARYRSSIALHGEDINAAKNRTLMVSKIGADTLEFLVRKSHELGSVVVATTVDRLRRASYTTIQKPLNGG